MKAILTVHNIASDFVTIVLDADLRRDFHRDRSSTRFGRSNQAAFDEAAKMPLREE